MSEPHNFRSPAASPGTQRSELPATEDHIADGLARLGRSIKFKGEIRGTGDLYVDGQVEGKIELEGNLVTVGPEGRVQGDVSAKNLAVIGRMDGKARVADSTEIHALGTVEGEVSTARISVAYGAVLHATIDVVKPEQEIKVSPSSSAAKRRPDVTESSEEAASNRDVPAELQLTTS